MDSRKIKVQIKQAADNNIEVEINQDALVKELKEQLVSKVNADSTEMKLIFKGKILKDHETLEACKVEDGITMHLVF